MLTKEEVLDALSDGHAIWDVEYAEAVCKFFDFALPKHLITKFKSDPEGTLKGITMEEGKENTEGVDGLVLSRFVADSLGVSGKANDYFGRGSQAREYARVIANHIEQVEIENQQPI